MAKNNVTYAYHMYIVNVTYGMHTENKNYTQQTNK